MGAKSHATSGTADFGAGLAGGLTLAAASTLLLASIGELTGISGITETGLLAENGSWQTSYIAGMVAAGALIAAMERVQSGGVSPRSQEPGLLSSVRPAAVAVAGVLIGAGSRLSGGCTSGHGICGLPRLSLRSFVAVMTFMTTGALTAMAVHSAAARAGKGVGRLVHQVPEGVMANSPRPKAGQAGMLATLVSSLLPTLATMFVLQTLEMWLGGTDVVGKMMWRVQGMTDVGQVLGDWDCSTLAAHGVGALCGAMFAYGLHVSGMCSPSKVLGFLSPWALPRGSGWAGMGWDPQLMAVMGGGVLGNAVTFRALKNLGGAPFVSRLCGSASSFSSMASPELTLGQASASGAASLSDCIALGSCTRNDVIDARLLVGAALFGIGWGLSGVCPGPALVKLPSGDRVTRLLVPCMLVGMEAVRLYTGQHGAGTCG